MTKLEELIERLCPDGVEYKTLGKTSSIIRGASPRPIKKFITSDDKGVNWIKIGDVKPGEKYITTVKEKITLEGAMKSRFVNIGDFILSNSMSFGRPYILKVDGCIHDGWLAISQYEDFYDRDFLYYLLCSSKVQAEFKKKVSFGGAVQNLNSDIVKSVALPVPPLEVQREIVRTLDNFTFLSAELAAELAARQKQYEHYRNLLLTFESEEDNVRWMKLGDTCVLKAGKAISATEISQNINDDYIYPCYGGNGLRGYVKNYNQDGEHPLVGRQGALCGNVCYACNKFYATEHAIVVTPSVLYNEKFLYYLLGFAKLEQYKTAGAQPGLSVAKLEKVVLPVPPLEVQRRIVDILDRFNALCSDISSGLPAEIEARQKQYEYYRDKLLNFKELKKEA